MKYIDEYRHNEQVQQLIGLIDKAVLNHWNIMEICGGQTHSIARYGIDKMLPDKITLLHGPGCPVCVTPTSILDQAIEIAFRPNVIMTSFGDMMRVPGNKLDLLGAKARGADVRILYSTLDAVNLAERNPEKEIVFLAVGFETTIPLHLTAIKEAARRKLTNFSVITSLFTVPVAMDAILSEKDCKVDGFLAAGHVCAVMGYHEYHALADKFRKPIIVTGFEPADLLYGIYQCVLQLENKTGKVENAYKRIVSEAGNLKMQELIKEMLVPVNQEWRGIGELNKSGLKLADTFRDYDALCKFDVATPAPHQEKEEKSRCIAGDIMRGNKQAADCPFFGITCTPEHPVGAPMVSAEGVCAAYYSYK
jgi:hydrogenase expression/formation protein HypD